MKIIEIKNLNLSVWKNWKRLIKTKILYFSFLYTSIKYWAIKWKTETIELLDEDEFYINWKLKAKK